MPVDNASGELLSRAPRSLPGWVTKRRLGLYVAAAAVSILAAIQLGIVEGIVAVVPPLMFASAFALMAVVEIRRRDLLRNGEPTVATVKEVTTRRGVVRLVYQYGQVVGSSALYTSDCEKAFGRVPSEGDALVVVHDPRRPERSRVWGPIRPGSAGVREREPHVSSAKKASRFVRGAGLFLALGCGVPLAIRFVYSVDASPVMECTVSHSHRYYNNVTLESGRQLALSPDDILDPARCLPRGTVVEKRRWESGYRVDGVEVFPASPSWKVVPALFTVGLVLFGFSFWRGRESLVGS